MMRLIAFLAAILLATSAGAVSTTSTNVDIIVTHAGGPVQTLIPITQQSGTVFQFLAGTGSANTPVGNIVPAAIFPPVPAFAGSWAITGGADAGKFKINPANGVVSVCNTAPSCSDLAAGTYTIVITVSQPGVVGSPASTTVTLQGVDPSDTKTPFLVVDNYAPAPGSTIHATVRNAPNASGLDYLFITMRYPRGYSNSNTPLYQPYIGPAGTHNATVSLPVPNPPTDNYQFLHVDLIPNNGQPSSAIALTSTILVPPSITPAAPTSANTLTPPFTPSQTLTVCPAGCQYQQLSAAIIGLSNSNHSNTADNVLITMQGGTYEDCIQFGNSSPFTPPTNDHIWHLPKHLWVQGVGGSMPRIEGMLNPSFLCAGKGLIVFWGGPSDLLTLDNLELADWDTAGPSGGIYAALGNITWRNLYIHDGEMCIITGNSGSFNYSLQNVHFARCGGSSGPSHDAYFGEGANTLDINHSLLEQALLGHEVKSRAWINHFSCNQFRGSQDPYYVDSEEIDCPEGRECHIDNNVVVKGSGSTQQNQIGWAQDVEGGAPPQPAHIWSLTLNNNLIIDDDPNKAHWFVYIGPGVVGPTYMTSPPNAWTNNTFVGGPAGNTWPYQAQILPALPAYPDTTQVTESGNVQYATRAAAGITQTYPPPPGCSGTVGNMAVP
jgi:hypothetical protein